MREEVHHHQFDKPMSREFVSSALDNREISVPDHRALFQLVNVIDAHGRLFEVFPRGKRIYRRVKVKTGGGGGRRFPFASNSSANALFKEEKNFLCLFSE